MRHALLVAVLAVVAGTAAAQGPPASVNSLGFGRSFAPPPSVTSLGPTGYSNLPILLGNPAFPNGGFRIGGRHGHHPGFGGVGFGGVGAVYVPYYVPVTPVYMTPDQVGDEPVMMDRPVASYGSVPADNGDGYYASREQPVTAQPPVAPATAQDASTQTTSVAGNSGSSLEPEDETVLVFKDGHRLQITNYAIQGTTLFNLSGEGPRKISVADLDIAATTKENDDRGVEFRLP